MRLYYSWQLHLVETGGVLITEATSQYSFNVQPFLKLTLGPGIFAWNDVWAHIEACASIVTACPPTLAPLLTKLGAPGSLLSSIRSIFHGWGSSVSLLRGVGRKETKETSSEISGAKKTWYKLEARSEAHAVDERRLGDEESLVHAPGSIQVQKSFGSHIE